MLTNIVYSPMWLGVEPPSVPLQRLMDWFRRTRPQQIEVLKSFDRTDTIYDAGYDFEHEKGFVSLVTHPLTGEWFADFAEEFPELVAFFERYPMKNKRVFAQSYYADEDLSKRVHHKWHIDRDTNQLGMRFSAYVDGKPRLMFRRIKPLYSKFYLNRHGRRCTVPAHHIEEKATLAPTLQEPHAWCFDTCSTVHAVDGYPINDRSIFILYGDLDEDRLKEVLQASAERYPEHCLTFDGL